MTLRPILVSAALFIAMAASAYIIYDENAHSEIAPTEAVVKHLAAATDPLPDQEFSPGKREANFQRYGLEGELLKETLDLTTRYDDRFRKKLSQLVADVTDPTALGDDLCGRTQDRRPRYGALAWLIKQDKSERRPMDLDRLSRLERQEWATTAPIDKVYVAVELRDGRAANATLMAVAGIIARQEEKVLNGYAPWGEGLFQGWSWGDVTKQHPGIEELSRQYFAEMHLLLEIVHGEDGICGA